MENNNVRWLRVPWLPCSRQTPFLQQVLSQSYSGHGGWNSHGDLKPAIRQNVLHGIHSEKSLEIVKMNSPKVIQFLKSFSQNTFWKFVGNYLMNSIKAISKWRRHFNQIFMNLTKEISVVNNVLVFANPTFIWRDYVWP
jgi:hypothetical protein